MYHLTFFDYSNKFICYLKDIDGDFITFTYDFKEAGHSIHKENFNYIVSLIGVQCLHSTLEYSKSFITKKDFKTIESGSFKTKILTIGEIRKLKIKKIFEN
jgi:hypothetical protein